MILYTIFRQNKILINRKQRNLYETFNISQSEPSRKRSSLSCEIPNAPEPKYATRISHITSCHFCAFREILFDIKVAFVHWIICVHMLYMFREDTFLLRSLSERVHEHSSGDRYLMGRFVIEAISDRARQTDRITFLVMQIWSTSRYFCINISSSCVCMCGFWCLNYSATGCLGVCGFECYCYVPIWNWPIFFR